MFCCVDGTAVLFLFISLTHFYFFLGFLVMGLLLGRPDPHSPTTLIVTDAFPLPIEGFETRVIADDQNVVNHMISVE